EGLDARLDEERREAQPDAVLLLELVLVLRPQGHDGGQVGLVEGGERGGRLLRLDEAGGDPLADRAHPLAGLALAGRGGGGGRGRGGGGAVAAGARCRTGEDVFLRDPPAAAGAGELARVDALRRGEDAGRRGHGRLPRGGGRRGLRGGRGLGRGLRRGGGALH